MTYIFIGLGVVVLIFIFLVVIGGGTTKIMTAASMKAVEHAKNNGVVLDYKEESIDTLNTFLQLQYEGGVDNKQYLAEIYGAYIGEVITKINSKCFWTKGHPELGLDVYCIKRDGSLMVPASWVEKYLCNGTEDNISHKYNVWKKLTE